MSGERPRDTRRAVGIKPLSVKGWRHLLDPERHPAFGQSDSHGWGEVKSQQRRGRHCDMSLLPLGHLGALASGGFSSVDGLSSLLSAVGRV